MKYTWRLIAVVFTSSILGGCFSTALRSSKTLTIAIHDDPESLSPDQAKRALDLSVSKLIFEGLTRENPHKHNQVEFALASHYTVSADEKPILSLSNMRLYGVTALQLPLRILRERGNMQKLALLTTKHLKVLILKLAHHLALP
ncbi:ABC transporter/periplasmic oligopeptide binding lipocomponent domain protein [Chlamydia psittaci WS/RT/E30]|nr:ABC transporter/periplasmic oligopeptide binding lipocomponent domain protein [Chlamydia psittaci WS/RT/E30]